MTSKRVAIRLAAENGRQVRDELRAIGDDGARSFQKLSRGADLASKAVTRLAGLALGAISIRQVQQYADTWTDLSSRVNLATGSQERGAVVMERLASMARRTYSSLEMTTESWLANATALRELGMSTKDTLDFTEALNNALVVSGAKSEVAEQVQTALSKAMMLGSLRGTNLNTVLSRGGRVAELLAKELNTDVSSLLRLGQQGKITGDVIRRALVGNLELLREEADSMPATIGDAFTLIGNAALQLVGKWDKMSGASSLVASALIHVADNLERVASYAIAFAVFMGGRWVAAFVAARLATASLSTALVVLRGALLRTGIGALIVAAGELVYWFSRVVTAAGGLRDTFWRVFEVGKQVFLGVGRTAWGLSEILAGIASAITGSFVRAFAEIAKAWDLLVNGMAAGWNLLADSALGEKLGLGRMGGSDISGTIGAVADGLFSQASDSIRSGGRRIVAAAKAVKDAMDAAVVPAEGETSTDPLEEAAAAARRVDDATKKGGGKKKEKDEVDALIKSLEREMAVLRETDPIKKQMLEYSKQLASATDEQKQKVLDLVNALDREKNGFAAIGRTLKEYAEEARRIGDDIGKALVGAFQSAEEAIGNFVKTGKLDFRDLVTSMIADLAKLAARAYILGPLAGILGNAFPSLAAGLKLPVQHMGGAAGSGPTREVSPLALIGAPRLHNGTPTGLRADEYGAILQRGERVLNRRQTKEWESRQFGGPAPIINFNVRDAQSIRQSRTQLAADASRLLSIAGRGM